MAKNERNKTENADQSDVHNLDRLFADPTWGGSEVNEQVYVAAHDAGLPLETRASMFLIYGVRVAGKNTDCRQPLIKEKEDWLRRAYYFGLKYGLPPQPRMVTRILEYEEGLDLAVAYVRECDAAPVFKIKQELGLALLDSGMDASGLISLCRALHAIEPLSERLLDASEEIAMILPAMLQVEEPKAVKLRRDQVESLSALIGEYMLRTRSTKVIILLAGFINTMLASSPLTSDLVGTIYGALSAFLKFDDAKLTECLKIEIDQDLGRVTSPLKEVTDILDRQRRRS